MKIPIRTFCVLLCSVCLGATSCSGNNANPNNLNNSNSADQGVTDMGTSDAEIDMGIGADMDMGAPTQKVCGDLSFPLEGPRPIGVNDDVFACACQVSGGEVFVMPGQTCPPADTLPDHPKCQSCFEVVEGLEGEPAAACTTAPNREAPDWSNDGFTCVCANPEASFNYDDPFSGCQDGVKQCEDGLVPSVEVIDAQCTQSECEDGSYADHCGASRECLQSIGCDCALQVNSTCVEPTLLVAAEPGKIVTSATVSLLRGDVSEHFIRWQVAEDALDELTDVTLAAADLALERKMYEPTQVSFIGADLSRGFFTDLCVDGASFEDVWVLVRYRIDGAWWAQLQRISPKVYCNPEFVREPFRSAGFNDSIGLLDDISGYRVTKASDCYCDMNTRFVKCRDGFVSNNGSAVFESAACRENQTIGTPDKLVSYITSPEPESWTACTEATLRIRSAGAAPNGFVAVEVEACPGAAALDFQDVVFVADTNQSSLGDSSALQLFEPLRTVTSEGTTARTVLPVRYNMTLECTLNLYIRAFVREGETNRATPLLGVQKFNPRCVLP